MTGRYFSGFLTGILGGCMLALFVQAQDTGRVHPAHNDTSVAAGRRDTVRSEESPAVPNRAPDTPVPANVRPSAGAPSGAGLLPATKPDTVPGKGLPLPPFARDTLDSYRSFVHALLDQNAIFKPVDSSLPDITAFRNEGQGRQTALYTGIFYVILGVLLFLAILHVVFTKYFRDLFRAFVNPTLSQRQLREQLSQMPFPSFLLNVFFCISAGLYLFLLLLHYHYFVVSRPLVLIPVFAGLVMAVYSFKYLFLRFAGWLFGYREMAAGYAFTLYMVNKVLGIALLPFILMLAFSPAVVAGVALTVSLILIILLFIYRYIRIYGMARNQIFFQKFHFFVYLCAFEIAPILIVGKLVLIWLNGA